MKCNADNLETEVTDDGRVLIEPSYIGYLRSQGYQIDGINEVRAVPSESEKGKAHIVMEIQTYEYPKNHSELDLVAHKMGLKVCDCWSYRQNSNDVGEGEKPGGCCKHISREYREEKAKQDDDQATLEQA